MRNPITLTTLILATLMAAPLITAQTPPQAISYQALVRDGAGQPLRNQAVSLRIRLHQDSANAIVSYAETFVPTTNGYGNVNLSLGRGTAILGTFATLDWSRPMYVEIGVDPNGGTAYVDLGTTQLLSVPYALYAGRSATTGSAPVSSEIRDADGNTRVSTERSPNENIIRFDLNGTEKMRLSGNRLEFANIPGNSIFIGDSAGSVSTGPLNLFVGYKAGRINTTGRENTFAGYQAGYSNTSGSSNTFTGSSAGASNTTGFGNTFAGFEAGYSNTTGGGNIFAGFEAGWSNTTGGSNTFTGSSAGASNTTGSNNTFAGTYAGASNTTGPGNTFTGIYSGYGNTTGDHNVFLGDSAGYGNVSGKRNIYIGYASYAASGDSNNIFIGTGTGISLGGRVIQSNKLIIDNRDPLSPLIFGDFATDSLRINGGMWVARSITATAFNVSSDRRLKENIQPVTGALDGVGKINGVYYTYKSNAPDGNPYPQSRQIGVIAQDVEKVYPELVATQPGGYKAVDYPKLTAVLIEAVKELEAKNAKLEAANREMMVWREKVEAALRLSQVERDAAKVAKR